MLHKSGTRKQARDSLLVAARCLYSGEHIGHGAGTHRQQAFIGQLQLITIASGVGTSQTPASSARQDAPVVAEDPLLQTKIEFEWRECVVYPDLGPFPYSLSRSTPDHSVGDETVY